MTIKRNDTVDTTEDLFKRAFGCNITKRTLIGHPLEIDFTPVYARFVITTSIKSVTFHTDSKDWSITLIPDTSHSFLSCPVWKLEYCDRHPNFEGYWEIFTDSNGTASRAESVFKCEVLLLR